MATARKIYDGIGIMLKYEEDDDSPWWLEAEHDELFGADKPNPDSEDGRKLLELGWRWDHSLGCWQVFT